MGDPRHASTADVCSDAAASALIPPINPEFFKLFAKLLFAARYSAECRTEPCVTAACGGTICRDCQVHGLGIEEIKHLPSCPSGQVLDLVAKICAIAGEEERAEELARQIPPISFREEEPRTPSQGAARAGAPSQPIPFAIEPELWCPACGVVDCAWSVSIQTRAEVTPSDVKANQTVGYGTGNDDHALFTHQCAVTRPQARVKSRETYGATAYDVKSAAFNEPWTWSESRFTGMALFGADGFSSAQVTSSLFGSDLQLARRIVACVNFCEGIQTQLLEEQRPMTDLTASIDRQIAAGRVLSSGGVR